MPWDDWQFYVVTIVALLGLVMLVRQVLPDRKSRDSACGGCATACEPSAADQRDGELVELGTTRT